jgi:monoamine oxidase
MTTTNAPVDSGEDSVLDVAIVGGGVSGLYSAWRLRSADHAKGKPFRLTVFEGSNRIGGRLLSLTPKGMPQTRCEMGGMRYMSRHRLVAALVDHFHLRTEDMPVAEDNNIAYLRGQQLRLSDLNSADKIPYQLRSAESYLLVKNLLMVALTQIVPNCEQLAGKDFAALQQEMQSAEFDNVYLYKQGFWNVLARILSPDAYAFVRDSCGYDCLVSNWNAADAIAFILADFGTDVKYSRFPDGFDQLPKRLAKELQDAGGRIELGACLKGFDIENGTVALTFTDGRKVLARKLVLAMPRRSLELLDANGPVLSMENQTVRRLIESVEPIPLFKIFVCYSYPWWKSVNVEVGRSVTDLPIRQCYYWGVEPKDDHTDGNSALLASYDDDLSVSFWAGLRQQQSQQVVWPPKKGWNEECWENYEAPEHMLAEIHRQLVQMHGVGYAPQPYTAAYRDWAEDPYGGGVNFWQIHAKSWEVIPAIVNPVPGLPVYICGEAYSHEQGWVEGALQTAELMLTQHFDLNPYISSPGDHSPACAGAIQ